MSSLDRERIYKQKQIELKQKRAVKLALKAKLDAETSAAETKTAGLRPIIDVINRIKHDPDIYDTNPFIIGYLDRKKSIIDEVSFPLYFTHIDYTDIPNHRIQYVKYYDLKIWEKCSRIDRVF